MAAHQHHHPPDGAPERDDAREQAGAGTTEQQRNQKDTPNRGASAGEVGLQHYRRLIGPGTTTSSLPLYAIVDHRRCGFRRIVSEHVDPESARTAADLLRSAGAAVEVVLVTAIEAS